MAVGFLPTFFPQATMTTSNIHTTSFNWVKKRLAMYEAAEDKARSKCVKLFHVLSPQLASINQRYLLQIEALLNNIIAQAKVNFKAMKPYRAYKKRLSTTLPKEKVPEAWSLEEYMSTREGEITEGERGAAEDEIEVPAVALTLKPRPCVVAGKQPAQSPSKSVSIRHLQ
ncbi:hypothetical protein OH76DRAFT_1484840 [Lentinus brumalis]|uniref:Uncharacterized protein n=1 Tax=Lentinus brumalis TaxID=2498619 RepID=A0A371D3X0_9APHY|nr:hypothetical protein OH76DRAFT_1484840 [Polyporus brumalis]